MPCIRFTEPAVIDDEYIQKSSIDITGVECKPSLRLCDKHDSWESPVDVCSIVVSYLSIYSSCSNSNSPEFSDIFDNDSDSQFFAFNNNDLDTASTNHDSRADIPYVDGPLYTL
jgi:hypothetical protein